MDLSTYLLLPSWHPSRVTYFETIFPYWLESSHCHLPNGCCDLQHKVRACVLHWYCLGSRGHYDPICFLRSLGCPQRWWQRLCLLGIWCRLCKVVASLIACLCAGWFGRSSSCYLLAEWRTYYHDLMKSSLSLVLLSYFHYWRRNFDLTEDFEGHLVNYSN